MFSEVGAAIFGDNPLAADPLVIESSHGHQQKAHRDCLLLIRQHLDVSHSCVAVDGHMSFFVTGTMGGAQAAITGDPLTEPLKAGELFGVDVDCVARSGPLEASNTVSIHQCSSNAPAIASQLLVCSPSLIPT